MNKKGFTLVELLCVIAILAILVVIALPNILSMFNSAKKNAFEAEAKNVYTTAEQQWISDTFISSGTKVYSHCESGCNDKLSVNARDNLEYYIEFSSKGDVVKYYISDGNYQYRYEGTGLKKTDIKDVEFVPNVEENDKLVITGEGVYREPQPVTICTFYEDTTKAPAYYIKYENCMDNQTIGECLGYTGVAYHYSEEYKVCVRNLERKMWACGLSHLSSPAFNNCYNNYANRTEISVDSKVSDYLTGCISPNAKGTTGCCLDGDNEVEVYDKKKKKRYRKKLKDVTYDDLVLAWDFDKGEYVWVKPFWIMAPTEIGRHLLLTFSDGSELKVIGDHRIYDCDMNKFMSAVNAKIGMKTINSNGEVIELVSKKEVVAPSTICNVITEKHINLFVNGILTSRGSNNLYEIKDMKFVKEERETIQRDELDPVDDEVYENLRLGERPINMYGNRAETVKHLNELVKKLLSEMKR